MKRPYLEVMFRKGKAMAAYLYLPRPTGAKAARTVEARPSILVDYSTSGQPIGIELTAPGVVDVGTINAVLAEIGLAALDESELKPLRAGLAA
jgi:uncharacterized protein YuzE